MMSDPRRHLPPMIRAELEGCAWQLANGGKHTHLKIDGKMVAALPRGRVPDCRTWLRVRAAVRRHRKELAS
jgi:hypothetical protein